MKRFIVYDEYSDYKTLTDEKGLIEILMEDLKRDTLESGEDDFNIVKNNMDVIEQLVYKSYTISYLIKELASFGWVVKDLISLHSDLTDFKTYMNNNDKCIQKTLDMIESEMK